MALFLEVWYTIHVNTEKMDVKEKGKTSKFLPVLMFMLINHMEFLFRKVMSFRRHRLRAYLVRGW